MRADQTVLMLGQSIQQDLALIGVHVVLRPIAWGPFLEAIRQPHTAQSFLYGWEGDFPDPENFLGALLSRTQWGANNDSFYYNPVFEHLIDQAALQTDFTKRYALYNQAEKTIIADAPWVFLYYPVTYVIRQPWVHDYDHQSDAADALRARLAVGASRTVIRLRRPRLLPPPRPAPPSVRGSRAAGTPARSLRCRT